MSRVVGSFAAVLLAATCLVGAAQPAFATTKVSATQCSRTTKNLLKVTYSGGESCYTGAGNLYVNLKNVRIVQNYNKGAAGVQDPSGKYYNIPGGSTLGNPPSTVSIVEIDGSLG